MSAVGGFGLILALALRRLLEETSHGVGKGELALHLLWRGIAAALLATIISPAGAGELPRGLSTGAAAVAVCFVPGENCDEKIIDAIDHADRIIRVQAYYLTSTAILGALRKAIQRGVIVEAILDRVNAQKNNASANYLRLAGASVWIDNKVTIAHNKVILVDDWLVIGGSYNYTKSAQTKNAENVLFVDSKDVFRQFEQNWHRRKVEAAPYQPG